MTNSEKDGCDHSTNTTAIRIHVMSYCIIVRVSSVVFGGSESHIDANIERKSEVISQFTKRVFL